MEEVISQDRKTKWTEEDVSKAFSTFLVQAAALVPELRIKEKVRTGDKTPTVFYFGKDNDRLYPYVGTDKEDCLEMRLDSCRTGACCEIVAATCREPGSAFETVLIDEDRPDLDYDCSAFGRRIVNGVDRGEYKPLFK